MIVELLEFVLQDFATFLLDGVHLLGGGSCIQILLLELGVMLWTRPSWQAIVINFQILIHDEVALALHLVFLPGLTQVRYDSWTLIDVVYILRGDLFA